jgi:hypothetical protein
MSPAGEYEILNPRGNELTVSVDWHSYVPAEPKDHILTVIFKLPVANFVPSLFHATDVTELECPVRVDTH